MVIESETSQGNRIVHNNTRKWGAGYFCAAGPSPIPFEVKRERVKSNQGVLRGLMHVLANGMATTNVA